MQLNQDHIQHIEGITDVVHHKKGNHDRRVAVHIETGPQGDGDGIVEEGSKHDPHPEKEHIACGWHWDTHSHGNNLKQTLTLKAEIAIALPVGQVSTNDRDF